MGRVRRLKVIGEDAYYHIVSRTVGGEFYLGDVEKEKLLSIIKSYSSLYFVRVIGFCIMDNHFHLLVKSETGEKVSDDKLLKTLCKFYNKDEVHFKFQLPKYREKLSDISEYMKAIKLSFTRWYNRVNNRTGYFWGDRFKSVLVDSGSALLNMLAYIDLNPIRAGIVDKPEDYRWSSIGYHIQSGNKDRFLSFDGVFEEITNKTINIYRELVYRAGGIAKENQGSISLEKIEKEILQDFELPRAEIFKHRVRYFTDGAVIGSKGFIKYAYNQFGGTIIKKKDRNAHKTNIGSGIFSLRCLRV
jgi:REP element-mobilizing transposase RayT